jgi:nitrogen regulatory protein PII
MIHRGYVMREIKAYLRPECVEAVVVALHEAGVSHMTLTHVRSLGSGVDPGRKRISLEAGEWYTEKAKLDFVCPDPNVDNLVSIIQANAHTGQPGDGIVFVSPVERALKIRTEAGGREALV